MATYEIGDKVCWADPDGETTCGWTVIGIPDLDDDGNVPDDGIITIRNASGSEAEVYVHELRKESV